MKFERGGYAKAGDMGSGSLSQGRAETMIDIELLKRRPVLRTLLASTLLGVLGAITVLFTYQLAVSPPYPDWLRLASLIVIGGLLGILPWAYLQAETAGAAVLFLTLLIGGVIGMLAEILLSGIPAPPHGPSAAATLVLTGLIGFLLYKSSYQSILVVFVWWLIVSIFGLGVAGGMYLIISGEVTPTLIGLLTIGIGVIVATHRLLISERELQLAS